MLLDREALLAQLDDLLPSLLVITRARVRDPDLARDIVQEACEKLIRLVSARPREVEEPARYIVGSLMRTISTVLARRAGRAEHELAVGDIADDAAAGGPAVDVIQRAGSPADTAVSRTAVTTCLEQLGRRERLLVFYRLVADLSDDQVAEVTGETPAMVRGVVHRAKKKLKACLQRQLATNDRE